MKKLEMKQMEGIEGGDWQSVACRIAFGLVGFAIGAAFGAPPVGAMIMGTIGNIVCYATPAQ